MVWTTVKLAGAFLAMIAALFLLQRILLKARIGRFAGPPVRILHTTRIGVRSYVAFLQIPDAILVLGVTPSNITHLMTIQDSHQMAQLMPASNDRGLFHRYVTDWLKSGSTSSPER